MKKDFNHARLLMVQSETLQEQYNLIREKRITIPKLNGAMKKLDELSNNIFEVDDLSKLTREIIQVRQILKPYRLVNYI